MVGGGDLESQVVMLCVVGSSKSTSLFTLSSNFLSQERRMQQAADAPCLDVSE